MKNTIHEINNTVKGVNSRLEKIADQTRALEDKVEKILKRKKI